MDEEKVICHACVKESYLSSFIKQNGASASCSFCGKMTKTISLERFADIIQAAFDELYVRTPEDPEGYEYAMMSDPDLRYEWERSGDPIIDVLQDAAEISLGIAADVQEILGERFSSRSADEVGEETDYSEDSYYDFLGANSRNLEEEWQVFESSLKTESRYFNQFGQTHLQDIFAGIDKVLTGAGSPILQVGPSHETKTFFRARLFQSDESLVTALRDIVRHLGPPPHRLARAGRMNAYGIAVFYGATDVMTALSEVRPPVGSRVVVTTFKIIRNLRLLDLEGLSKVKVIGSIFDEKHRAQLARIRFLKQLCDKMIVPVMPDDEQSEYLITQAIADFLSMNKQLNLDGIQYPSIQHGGSGSNVVLFQKASRVASRELPIGTTTTVQLEDYDEDKPYTSYVIHEETVPLEEQGKLKKSIYYSRSTIEDKRPVSLAIDEKNIHVHHMLQVSFTTDPHHVQFSRHEKYDSDS
jgi:hypothetical protein